MQFSVEQTASFIMVAAIFRATWVFNSQACYVFISLLALGGSMGSPRICQTINHVKTKCGWRFGWIYRRNSVEYHVFFVKILIKVNTQLARPVSYCVFLRKLYQGPGSWNSLVIHTQCVLRGVSINHMLYFRTNSIYVCEFQARKAPLATTRNVRRLSARLQ